jgi:class 3 adenylate cyclase
VLPGKLLHLVPLQFAYHTSMAFLTAWVCLELRRQGQRLAFMLGAVFLTLTFTLVMALRGVLFEPFSGILAILLTGIVSILLALSVKDRLVHEFRSYFIDRLDEEQFSQVIEKREPTRLSGLREVTAMTFKLVNAGNIIHTVRPDPMAMLSASVMKTLSEFLIGQGAYIERCSAHGVVALFGFPMASQDHAQQACSTLPELRQMLTQLAHEIRTRWMCEAHFGIGIASGKVMCGLYGHSGFQSYGAIGEAVELSEKLSSLNALYGSRMLIAESTLQRMVDIIEARPIGVVSSETTPENEVAVHEWLAMKGKLTAAEEASRDRFTEGLSLLRAGQSTQAAAVLKQAQLPGHEDAPLRYFLTLAKATPSQPSLAAKPAHAADKPVEKQAPAEAAKPLKASLQPIVIGSPPPPPATAVSPLRALVTGTPVPRLDPEPVITEIITADEVVEIKSTDTTEEIAAKSPAVTKDAKGKANPKAKA